MDLELTGMIFHRGTLHWGRCRGSGGMSTAHLDTGSSFSTDRWCCPKSCHSHSSCCSNIHIQWEPRWTVSVRALTTAAVWVKEPSLRAAAVVVAPTATWAPVKVLAITAIIELDTLTTTRYWVEVVAIVGACTFLDMTPPCKVPQTSNMGICIDNCMGSTTITHRYQMWMHNSC